MSETSEATTAAPHQCARCGTGYTESDACPACGALEAPVPCDDDPSRQAHSRCVLCGRALCDGSPEAGEPARCDEHRSVPVIEGFAQVYTNNSALGAQLLVDNLRAEGIDAMLYSQADRSFPMEMGEMSIARVLVPTFDYAHALELIRDYMDTEGEVVFACPACGEVYEPGQEACAACGEALTA